MSYNISLCHFGHSNNGSVRGTADEVFSRIKHPRNISQFLTTLFQLKLDHTETQNDVGNLAKDVLRPYFPEHVLYFQLNKLRDIHETGLLMLGFENLTAHGVEKLELRLIDGGLITSRPLTSFGQYDENLIVVDSKQKQFFEHHYNVVIEQNKFLEVDNNCVTYPSEFEDYQSCDEAFQREYLQKNIQCKPYWAFGHIDEEPSVCYFNESGYFNEPVYNAVNLLFVGATVSSCSPPCTTTIAKTKFRFEKVSAGKEAASTNWVVFYLPENIRVTETMLKDSTLSQILSDLGGTFGLWLGLGVLQLFQSVATFKVSLATKMLKKMYHKSSTQLSAA